MFEPSQPILVAHPSAGWQARHDRELFGGPEEISLQGQPLLRECRFRLDDLDNASAIVDMQRQFHKGGAAVVLSEGYFPYGGEIKFRQECRYAQNHLRVIFDLRWLRGTVVKRHFGLGSLRLPGKFRRYFCLPPAQHQAEGKAAYWQEIPAFAGGAPLMVGHWHRPPPAVVFEREDGLFVEIGTGSDLWRWEECLGAGPENGSYKIFLEADGLRFDREPLMCCGEFEPVSRPYRYTWYAAWGRQLPQPEAPQGEPIRCAKGSLEAEFSIPSGARPAFTLDASAIAWPASACQAPSSLALASGRRPVPCLESSLVQKVLRRPIRRLRELPDGILVLKGLNPGCCWDAGHMEKNHRPFVSHWDINGLHEYLVWIRQQLGPAWEIRLDGAGLPPLPSLASPCLQNGFGTEERLEALEDEE